MSLLILVAVCLLSSVVFAANTRVAVVSPALTSTFHVTLVKGAEAEAREFGWGYESLAPDRETNFQMQVSMVEDLIQRKVDAISICAINDSHRHCSPFSQ